MPNILIWAQRKPINNGTKLMDILNYCNLFVVQNNNHTRYDTLGDKMDLINYIISPIPS